MARNLLGLLLSAALLTAVIQLSGAVPVSSEVEDAPPKAGEAPPGAGEADLVTGDSIPVSEDSASSGHKPTVITNGNGAKPIIIDVPPTVDTNGAVDTSREEVETTHKRMMKSLGTEGTNEVPVRQSPLEVAVAAKLRSECARRAASACLKLKLLTYMNRLLKKASIPITDAVEISQTSEEVEDREDDEEEEEIPAGDLGEEALGELVAEKVAAFVRTRSLRWRVLPEADLLLTPSGDGDGSVEVGVSVRGGRAAEKARGKLKQILPLLAALKVKLGILAALAIAALALLVGKAVLVSKIAFLLAAVLALFKLLRRQQHKAVTYEVVSHPHYSHSHGSSSTSLIDGGHHHDGYSGGGYGRSILSGSDLAYRAHAVVNDGESKSDDSTNYR